MVPIGAALLLSAAFTYIVPAQGATSTAEAHGWNVTVRVTNPHDEPVTLRIDQTYARNGVRICPDEFSELTIAPRDSAVVVPTSCGGYPPLQAFHFTSSRRVIVVVDAIAANSPAAPQSIPVESAWFPAEEEVVITRVEYNRRYTRANLFLINPNTDPIVVSYGRFGLAAPGNTLVVPPLALVVHPLSEDEFLCPEVAPAPVPFDRTCGISVKATADFYVGASIIRNDSNAAVYRRGTPASEYNQEADPSTKGGLPSP